MMSFHSGKVHYTFVLAALAQISVVPDQTGHGEHFYCLEMLGYQSHVARPLLFLLIEMEQFHAGGLYSLQVITLLCEIESD